MRARHIHGGRRLGRGHRVTIGVRVFTIVLSSSTAQVPRTTNCKIPFPKTVAILESPNHLSFDSQHLYPVSSNPLPPLPPPIRPPYPNTTRRRAHQQRPIPIRNPRIRSTPLLHPPQQPAPNRAPKNRAQAPHKQDKRIHTRILPDTKNLGDERGEERVVTPRGEAVEHDEGEPEREGG